MQCQVKIVPPGCTAKTDEKCSTPTPSAINSSGHRALKFLSYNWAPFGSNVMTTFVLGDKQKRERDFLQSTHVFWGEHSSHEKRIGRSIPGVSICFLLPSLPLPPWWLKGFNAGTTTWHPKLWPPCYVACAALNLVITTNCNWNDETLSGLALLLLFLPKRATTVVQRGHTLTSPFVNGSHLPRDPLAR